MFVIGSPSPPWQVCPSAIRHREKKKQGKKHERREVGDDENWVQPKLRDRSNWIKRYDRTFPKTELVASAKTAAVKKQILEWQQEAPDDKIIGESHTGHSEICEIVLTGCFTI